jgi:hypothetical protein
LRLLEQLQISVDNLDMDVMEKIAEALQRLKLDGEQDELCAKLVEASEMMDVDTCATLIAQWKALL